jgi:CheY-like chemotaxis protein
MWSESGQKVDTPAHEEFTKTLREALSHLHHADRLRSSPLVSLFGVANRFDAPSILRRILVDAVKSFEPDPDEPPQSRAWRIYDSLFCCYVQQLSQRVVADQLGLSSRQLRREQRAALEALAYRLCEQYDLGARLGESESTEGSPSQDASKIPNVAEELAWLNDMPPNQSVNLGETLRSTLDLTRPLATQYNVAIQSETGKQQTCVAVHPVALSQMLLNLLSASIPKASSSDVSISVRATVREAEVVVQCSKHPVDPRSAACQDQADSLDLAEKLAELSRCELAVAESDETFVAKLRLPLLEELTVLAIDDNEDTLQLLQRYVSNTRYRLVGASDPDQAQTLATQHTPQIIVLDVMMPQVDGWRVLGRLRLHPLTEHIPILVCTISPQEALALSLGASAFLRKPVTRQAFLNALDQVALAASTSR